MKSKFKLIGIITGAYLALFWGTFGILQVSDFQLPISLGWLDFFAKPHHNAAWQELVFNVCTVLTYPLAAVHLPVEIPDNWFAESLFSLFNGLIWGVCLAFLFYMLKYRFNSAPPSKLPEPI
jgi:hypothetical protein